MTQEFSETELQEWHEMFNSVDLENTGKMTEKQVYQLLKDAEMKQCYRKLIMKTFDHGNKGFLDFDDFCQFVNCLNHINSDPKLIMQKMFDSFDIDQKGELTAKQTIDYANLLKILSKEMSEKLIHTIDIESSALYSFDELCQAINIPA